MENRDFNEAEYEGSVARGAAGGMKGWRVVVLMLLSAAIACALMLMVLSSGLTRYRIADAEDRYDAQLISTLLEWVDRYYYGEKPDPDALVAAAGHALIQNVGDPYSAYYTDEEYASFTSEMNGKYKGIGVSLYAPDENGALLARVYEGNFAYEAGLREGDYITAVDGESVISKPIDDVTALITGEAGTTVEITVKRGDETLKFDVERGDIYIKRIDYRMLEDKMGYIRIDSFTGKCAEEFDSALADLEGQGMTSLIIDLRDNPGGTLDVVNSVCDRILPECTITTLKGNTINPENVYSSTAEHSIDIPYVLLINEYSASCSEIMAGAVQDNETGFLIGTTTYGKGIVQTTWNLGGGYGWIKLTTDAYYTPSGKSLNGVGVTPDRIVELPEELKNYDIYTLMRDHLADDTQLKAAIEYLNDK